MATEPVVGWTTVRISQSLKPMLGELAEETGMSQGDVIGVALSHLQDEILLEASNKAYEMAGIKNPIEDLDLAELHDAFTGTEIMAYEDCFFCEEGRGGNLIDDGSVMAEGKLPVNLSGGLIGCGHAVGASGIMQTVEVALHLRGDAGERQRKNARRGLVQSIGGTLCTWTICLVLEREG